jgi:invasion protein IalB
MRLTIFGSLAALALTLPLSAPALAQAASQQQQQQQQSSAKKAPDPNQIVCEKQQEIGSRLATDRVCMTRAQWAEQKRNDRDAIEKAQRQRGMNTPQ